MDRWNGIGNVQPLIAAFSLALTGVYGITWQGLTQDTA